MAYNIVMPALEMAQETGKLLAWRKKEGDTVSQGDPLVDIETDKAVVEIESPSSGILAGVAAREGDVVPVGQTIGWIVLPGESVPDKAQPQEIGSPVHAKASASSPLAAMQASSRLTPSEIKISPKARRLAREHGIDLSRVRGSGNEGEILADDVLAVVASAESATKASAPAELQTMSAIARLMAERTTQSWTSVPHFFIFRDIDAGGLLEAKQKISAAPQGTQKSRVTYTDILVSVLARALVKHPRLNASWVDGGIRLHKEVNIGIAVAAGDGVVNIVIPGADTKNFADIAALRLEMLERARAGRSRPEDLRGATFTISNLGMHSVDAFTAIIPPQQAAILAVGRVADRVVPVNGIPGVRPMMTVALSCDHRVVDGARTAAFLNDFADIAGQTF